MPGKTSGKKTQSRKKTSGTAKRSKRRGKIQDANLIRALNHELRREILRIFHASKGGRSPVGISEELGEPLAGVSYHVQILHDCEAVKLVRTEQVRGALKHYYASTVEGHEIACALLESTAKADRKSLGKPAKGAKRSLKTK